MNKDRYHRMIHDTIHGSFYLHKLLWSVIDTPEFQRLRNIKQTGNTHFVYDGSNHTRFEHSIGVAHLCGEFAQHLRRNTGTNELITEHDILILQVAGLCHDIGHCAFSHLFDGDIIPYFHPDEQGPAGFRHEQASYLILKRIYKELKAEFNNYGLFDKDICFIGRLILGSKDKVPPTLRQELVWTKEDNRRQFMFQILANEIDGPYKGIDVDKFDYIKRDCHNTGISTGFDPQRLMQFAYIDIDSFERGLQFMPKAKELIREMWEARSNLHRRVYQHRVVKCFDEMVLEVFKQVADKVMISGDNGVVRLCDIHTDMGAYLQVTDHILTVIKMSAICSEPALSEARRLISLMEYRRNWSTILSAVLDNNIEDSQNCGGYQVEQIIAKLSSNIAIARSYVENDCIYYFFKKKELSHSDRLELNRLHKYFVGLQGCRMLYRQ